MLAVSPFRFSRYSLALAMMVGILATFSAHAQGLASLAGRIADPSGAVVPGAIVTIREVNTGYSRSSRSSIDGYYTIPSLRPSDYSLTVEAPGFRKYQQEGIVLTADQRQQ
jgi:hypothetical protein